MWVDDFAFSTFIGATFIAWNCDYYYGQIRFQYLYTVQCILNEFSWPTLHAWRSIYMYIYIVKWNKDKFTRNHHLYDEIFANGCECDLYFFSPFSFLERNYCNGKCMVVINMLHFMITKREVFLFLKSLFDASIKKGIWLTSE